MKSIANIFILASVFAAMGGGGAAVNAAPSPARALWGHDNLVAWCIVPYDAKKRDPEARAQMLEKLGFRSFAYDWRAEHVASFDTEVETMLRHHIEIVAWWFPGTLDENARRILAVIERHGIHPQLWVSGGGEPTKSDAEQRARIEREVARIRPIVAAAARLGCSVGLYNHGGWFGEPDNQISVLEKLRAAKIGNVGLVYNFHHGHAHIKDFAEVWPRLRPFVDTVNLNGMRVGADKQGKMILYVGEGDEEQAMMRVIQDSGWRGKIGLLNHRTDVDAEEGLRRNLAGLDKLAAGLRAAAAP